MSEIQPITFNTPEVHPKGWGNELWIQNCPEYCGKVLKFNKGASFSNHYHWHKKESWYVVYGQLLMRYYNLSNADQKERIIYEGEVVNIPAGNPHQLTALDDSMIFEVSSMHEDTDSYRIGKGDSQKIVT